MVKLLTTGLRAGTLLLALPLLISGCGFQLQGRADPSPEIAPVFLQLPSRNTDLARELVRALKVSKVPVAVSREDASSVLEIVKDRSGREVESISAKNRPQEYRVFYAASYRVTAGEEVLLAPQNVTRTRIYTYDETEVLAKADEESLLRQALAREIAGVIARRLATLESPSK